MQNLKYEKIMEKLYMLWESAISFDFRAKEAKCKLINNGYCYCVLFENTLATHNLEGEFLKIALGQDIYTKKYA